jgi:hypothetical protein
MQGFRGAGTDEMEILPLVVIARTFRARPSSLLDIRDFVREHLTSTPFSEDDIRALTQRVSDVLLEAAGPRGAVEVSLRIMPEHSEVDVIRSTLSDEVRGGPPVPSPRRPAAVESAADLEPAAVPAVAPPTSFAEWLVDALRREGMTMETAARRLGVSVKTVGRWAGGTTEPRWRDLTRLREIFGSLPAL